MNTAVAKTQEAAVSDYGISIAGMPMGLAIMFNDKLYERCKQMAKIMADAKGFTPPHLIGMSEACFAVVTRAITWKLDPQAVAQSTYQTPGGRIGYEGKLIQAILENSGRLDGNVEYELIGDWDRINGKFEIKKGSTGKDYAAPTWTRKDATEAGAGVIVSAQVKGEAKRRTLKVMLNEMFPLNSTLWATRPSQQIKYTACRAFAHTVAPGILMGEPFDIDPAAGQGMKDVTPPKRPTREDYAEAQTISIDPPAADETATVDPETGEVTDAEGEQDAAPEFGPADAYAAGQKARTDNLPRRSPPEWDQNANAEPLKAAWLEGWNDTDAEMAQAAKATTK